MPLSPSAPRSRPRHAAARFGYVGGHRRRGDDRRAGRGAYASSPSIDADDYILVGAPGTPGYRDYAALTAAASDEPPPRVDIDDDDIYNIIYSSGTTGQPKGIVHTHYVRALYCTMFASQFRFTPESVVMHAGSLVFNGAFVTLMPAWYLGCTFVLQEKFDAGGFIDAVERERVTHVMMVPSQIVAVINAPNFSASKLQSLRDAVLRRRAVASRAQGEAAAAAAGLILRAVRADRGLHHGARQQGLRAQDRLGRDADCRSARCASSAMTDAISPPARSGEIVGRSPLMMPGYYKRPDLTAQAIKDGWLFTGDVGMADDDGFLHLVDRKKDMIISGGVNVFPKDIEEVAVQHEAVREVAVFGVPNEKWGESPFAAVVLKSGSRRRRRAPRVDQRARRGALSAGERRRDRRRSSAQHGGQNAQASACATSTRIARRRTPR